MHSMFGTKLRTGRQLRGMLSTYLLRGLRQGSPLKALGDLAAQAVGVVDALEEEGVLGHALDAKGVVHTAHACHMAHTMSAGRWPGNLPTQEYL